MLVHSNSEVKTVGNTPAAPSPWEQLMALWTQIKGLEEDMLSHPDHAQEDLDKMASLSKQMVAVDSGLKNPVNDPQLSHQISTLESLISSMQQDGYNPTGQIDRAHNQIGNLDMVMQFIFKGIAL